VVVEPLEPEQLTTTCTSAVRSSMEHALSTAHLTCYASDTHEPGTRDLYNMELARWIAASMAPELPRSGLTRQMLYTRCRTQFEEPQEYQIPISNQSFFFLPCLWLHTNFSSWPPQAILSIDYRKLRDLHETRPTAFESQWPAA